MTTMFNNTPSPPNQWVNGAFHRRYSAVRHDLVSLTSTNILEALALLPWKWRRLFFRTIGTDLPCYMVSLPTIPEPWHTGLTWYCMYYYPCDFTSNVLYESLVSSMLCACPTHNTILNSQTTIIFQEVLNLWNFKSTIFSQFFYHLLILGTKYH